MADADAGEIGPELQVRGRLTGQGDMRVFGSLEGDVALDGALEIGPGARVAANVEARRVVVAGHLRGNVTAVESLSVCEGGILDGDVRAPAIVIEDGGALHGSIVMDFDVNPSSSNPIEGR